MRDIYDVRVYAPAHDADGEGLCVLASGSCIRQEALNGEDIVTLTHPYDRDWKWKYLTIGNVLKVFVIGRGAPSTASRIITLTETYAVNMNATASERDIFDGTGEGAEFLGRLDSTSTISNVRQCVDGMYLIDCRIGSSEYPDVYVSKAAVTIGYADTGLKDPAGTVEIKTQRFVIVKVSMNNNDITVTAKHISTCILSSGCTVDRLTGYGYEQYIPITTCVNRITAHTEYPLANTHRATIATTLNNAMHIHEQFKGAATAYEKLIGKKGVASVFGAEVLRDDDKVYLMGNIGTDRGVTIEIGNNASALTIINNADKSMYAGVYAYIDDPAGTIGVVEDVYASVPVEFDMICTGMKIFHDVATEKMVSEQNITNETNIHELMRQNARRLIDTQAEYAPSRFMEYDLSITAEINQAEGSESFEPMLLGDTVTVVDPRLPNGSQKMKIVGITRDCLTQRINRVDLGVRERSLRDVITEMR